eukprot:CAMPEP_0171351138 /NCGR_PEP_ID=MMETSP0878-20121228/38246_1 /TAXON_ID=67004 /ORGANISM="Thalassiosira weissflogii, Strain CCMP1336" /LENGTH=505 /DNA_ID=CAMNT_0011856309 /DNA_START=136 /DNA_END=1653 /DNA_ORIENTATION=-
MTKTAAIALCMAAMPVNAWDYSVFFPSNNIVPETDHEVTDEPTFIPSPSPSSRLQPIIVEAMDDFALCITGEVIEIDVLSNDIFYPADMKLAVSDISNNGKNGACFNLNRYIRYLSVAGFVGTDECMYKVCDHLGGCATAIVTILVTDSMEVVELSHVFSNGHRPPVAFGDPAILDEGIEGLFSHNDGDIDEEEIMEQVDGPMNSNDFSLNLNNCHEGDVRITIEVQTDQYGDDTTFELFREVDGISTLTLSRGPYASHSYDSIQLCAPNPSLHTFVIHDKYGDGICCFFGNGYFKIYLDDREIIHVNHFAHNSTQLINIGHDPKPSMTQRDIEYLLAHNKRRRTFHEIHNKTYMPLQWSHGLAEEARTWAYKLLNGCNTSNIEHEPGVQEGENLAKNVGNFAEWGKLYPPENIVRRWVDFEIGWLYPANAHLTQALWYASRYIGCGESVKDYMGGKCRVQVCRYAKAGNCNMKAYNATIGENWLEPMLMETSPCEPSCPPEGCF